MPGTGRRLGAELETTVYRLVQEALTNVVKHAQAGHVSIVRARRGRAATAVVEDDGRGFDPASENGGIGLAGMRERLALIGGRLEVGADLAVPLGREGRLRVAQAQVDRLEEDCDRFNAGLPELRSFVLPGGTAVAAAIHVARTICRRAEREAIEAAASVEINPLVVVYLNRLSDLLFILARGARRRDSNL